MTPLQRYQQDLLKEGFIFDPAQKEAVILLDDLHERLLLRSQRSAHLLSTIKKKLLKSPLEPEKGLYLWGDVGRGKTYLMDVFYDSLPFENKLRVHFHRFMQRIHRGLKHYAGRKNPMQLVVDDIASEVDVLCFDEFFVSDITDAVILAEFIKAIFQRGVCMVATSNIPPPELYKNGLQRARFVPAIALIEQYLAVHELASNTDYRLRVLEQAQLYHSPLGHEAEACLQTFFERLLPEGRSAREKSCINIQGRQLMARYEADDIVWFDFKELCDGPRSQNDYIELACEYHAVVVSDVPQLNKHLDDQARRFISMIDEFYDRSVKVVISAAVPLLELYADGILEFEFQRTLSRLQEMQSHDYLERAHQP